jgi:hypothetical protein
MLATRCDEASFSGGGIAEVMHRVNRTLEARRDQQQRQPAHLEDPHSPALIAGTQQEDGDPCNEQGADASGPLRPRVAEDRGRHGDRG